LLLAACRRPKPDRLLEETAYLFKPTALLGVYQYRPPGDDVTYIRFAFTGEITGHEAGRALDEDVIHAVWLTPEEVRREAARHRSPLVMRCIDDYLAGQRFPLDTLDQPPNGSSHRGHRVHREKALQSLAACRA
jgi:hypothetical protein